MAKIAYHCKRFSREHTAMIAAINDILDEYSAQGFVLTLRQLYYKFVARDLFPDNRKWVNVRGKWRRSPAGTKNAEPNYKWLGALAGDGRLAGLVDWDQMEDRVRALANLEHFAGAGDLLTKAAGWYHVDMWKNQEYRPEVWIEKDALSGMVAGVCRANDVPYFCCRGYTSLSEMWRASQRLVEHMEAGYKPYIIHFGDHDPSGIDMSRDIVDRLTKTFLANCEFIRVALNMDQIRRLNPPPNPVKITDSRHRGYIRHFGEESWELDAMEPAEFRTLIEGELGSLRDDKQWKKDVVERERVKKLLMEVVKDWDKLPDLRRQSGELVKMLAAAADAGWNGTENPPKYAPADFVRGLGEERDRLTTDNERLRNQINKRNGRKDK